MSKQAELQDYGNCVEVVVKPHRQWRWEHLEDAFHVLTYNMNKSEEALAERSPGFRFKEWWFECKPIEGATSVAKMCWYARG